MAEERNTRTTTVNDTQNQNATVIEEDLNLDAKVTVKNLAGWDVTFARLQDGHGDVVVVANGQQRLSRNEVIAQVNNNNKLFTAAWARSAFLATISSSTARASSSSSRTRPPLAGSDRMSG